MPIPEFDANGHLPVGAHECTLAEVEKRFGTFQVNDRRVRLFARLRELVSALQQTGLNASVVLDGSFVTREANPGDIDLIIVLPSDFDLTTELTVTESNLLESRHLRKHYQFDVQVVREGQPEYHEAVAFFQQVKGRPDQKKGLLRLIQ